MNVSEIKEQKAVILQSIQENLDTWDKTAEAATRIFEENEKAFEQLQELDKNLPPVEAEKISLENKTQILEIIEKQKELMTAIQNEKVHIQEQLGQLGKKNKVVSNYMAIQKKSLFVEKNY